MTVKELTKRVVELERELEELKAAPKTETHLHYHYPPYQLSQAPSAIPYPFRPWYTTSSGTSANAA